MFRVHLSIAVAIVLSSAVAHAEPIAFTGVRLISGDGAAPIENGTLVIEGDRILAVGAGTVALPEGTRTVALPGKTIMPGLISNHSHVGLVKGVITAEANYTKENIVAQLKTFAAKGVTTIMALGVNGGLFQDIRVQAHAGTLPGADAFGVDRGIGVPNGAPPQALLNPGPDQLFRPASADEARENVRAMKARGSDMVKLWLDDFGGMLPVKMEPAVYSAAIDEAHKAGLRAAVHVHYLEDARAVVAAGADILAHGIRDKPVDDAFIALMKEKGAWYIPTLSLDEASFIFADQTPWSQSAFVRDGMSPELRSRVDDPAWRTKVLEQPKTAFARRSLAMNLRNLKTLYDAGVKIGFGSDSGATPERVPGVAEHRELALMVEAGLTPLQAITIATKNAASLLGLEDRGHLAPGKKADFIVLDGDPSKTITDTEKIVDVWRLGRVVN